MADPAAPGALAPAAPLPGTPLLVALALAAVLLFWVIGAKNRLVALRNSIADAWAKVQTALDQRGAAVEPLVAALREPMAAEQGALDTWTTAHAEARKAAAALAARPVDESRAQAWVAAESALAQAWRDGQARLPFARQLYNEAAAAYNDALGVFPTPLVARAFKLGRAGTL